MKRKLWTVLAVMAMVTAVLSGCSLFKGEDVGDPSDEPQLLNVAFGKNTTTSSNHPRYPGELAVDGVWDTRESRWLSAIGAELPHWIEIDLEEMFVLERAEVWSGDTMGQPYPITDFELQYWADGQWKVIPGGVVEGNDAVFLELTFEEAVVTDKVRLFTDVQSPYPVVDNFDGVRIREILVFGLPVE